MKQDMLALQRMLETKERKMSELMRNSGQVPALRQQYDRVLMELQRERDGFVSEKAAIMQVSYDSSMTMWSWSCSGSRMGLCRRGQPPCR